MLDVSRFILAFRYIIQGKIRYSCQEVFKTCRKPSLLIFSILNEGLDFSDFRNQGGGLFFITAGFCLTDVL